MSDAKPGKARKRGPASMPFSAEVRSYLEAVDAILGSVLGRNLLAVYVIGSLSLGDFEAARSDIDLVAVCRRKLRQAEKKGLVEHLSHETLPCPAVGLDLEVLLESVTRSPGKVLPYEMGFSTGRTWGARIDFGGEDHELLIDLAVCRLHGKVLRGPAPGRLVATIREMRLIESLSGILTWHQAALFDRFHDPTGRAAVLNACRALHYATESALSSKSDAARWILARDSSVRVVRMALDSHEERGEEPLPGREVMDFLVRVSEILGARE